MAHWELRVTVCAPFLACVSATRKYEENEKREATRGFKKEREREMEKRERACGRKKEVTRRYESEQRCGEIERNTM